MVVQDEQADADLSTKSCIHFCIISHPPLGISVFVNCLLIAKLAIKIFKLYQINPMVWIA